MLCDFRRLCCNSKMFLTYSQRYFWKWWLYITILSSLNPLPFLNFQKKKILFISHPVYAIINYHNHEQKLVTIGYLCTFLQRCDTLLCEIIWFTPLPLTYWMFVSKIWFLLEFFLSLLLLSAVLRCLLLPRQACLWNVGATGFSPSHESSTIMFINDTYVSRWRHIELVTF